MKYIIADPDIQNGNELKKILDGYEMLEFQGNFTFLEAFEEGTSREPPDLAFIRMDGVGMNSFRLVREIRERNRASKVILVSSHKEYAVEAFEYGADGFLLIPFDRKRVKRLLQRWYEKRTD